MNNDEFNRKSKEAIADLRASYPTYFEADMPSWAIAYGAGWHRLIMRLMRSIEALLDDHKRARFRVVQIKEKWGTLRFYWKVDGEGDLTADITFAEGGHQRISVPRTALDDFPTESVRELVQSAESESAGICEVCGQSGQLVKGGWWLVLCSTCRSRSSKPSE